MATTNAEEEEQQQHEYQVLRRQVQLILAYVVDLLCRLEASMPNNEYMFLSAVRNYNKRKRSKILFRVAMVIVFSVVVLLLMLLLLHIRWQIEEGSSVPFPFRGSAKLSDLPEGTKFVVYLIILMRYLNTYIYIVDNKFFYFTIIRLIQE